MGELQGVREQRICTNMRALSIGFVEIEELVFSLVEITPTPQDLVLEKYKTCMEEEEVFL